MLIVQLARRSRHPLAFAAPAAPASTVPPGDPAVARQKTLRTAAHGRPQGQGNLHNHRAIDLAN